MPLTLLRRVSPALLALAIATPALAQSPMGKPVMPVHPSDIAGPACITDHRQVIDEALGIALERVQAGLALLANDPGQDLVRRWFGTAPPEDIARRLRAVGTWLQGASGARLRCNEQAGCRDRRMAYASPGLKVLGLCPAFFRARLEGYDSRWGILVHEVSHLAARTRDHAYGRRAAAILAKDDPARAAENADNYEYFLESLPR